MRAPIPRTASIDSQRTTRSLVRQLSRTLVWAVSAVWLVSTGLVAWYVDAQIQHNFDVELIESTHRQLYPAQLDWQQRQRAKASTGTGLETGVAAQPEVTDPDVMGEIPGDNLAEPLLMQLRDAEGKVLLRSAGAPASPFAVPLQAGFYDAPEHRVFSLWDASHQMWLQLADPLSERREATQRSLLGLVAVLLVMLPVLVWLIHWIARRELAHVQRLHRQIQARSGSNLQPLDVAQMPEELRAVGEEVNQLMHRLGEALNVERSLAANAAHELRTPLAQVRLRLHTAAEQAHAQQAASVPVAEVHQALSALETLSHRTERLLQLSRAEGGDAAYFAPVNLVQLAEQMAQTFWQQPAAHKRLDWLAPEDASAVWVLGDIDSLAIVLRNLIDNALHHTDAAVELQVRAQPQPMLVVRDHSAGLSAQALAQMQQRHVRVGSHHMGYGLGMSIVRTIADKHGGTLQLVSPLPGLDHGLEVQLWLPALPAVPTHVS